MSAPQWAELESMMQLEQRHRLVERLADLDDASRKTLAKPLRAYARSGDYDLPPRGSHAGLSLAGPAVLPDARAVSAWLRRFPPSPQSETPFTAEPALIAHVLQDRQAPWLPALVADLAERIRFDYYDTGPFNLVDLLRRGLGLAAPEQPAYVAMWFEHRLYRSTSLEALAAEPEYAALLPRVFEEDGVASTLRNSPDLAAAVAAGLVDRAAVLDAALARLQRGGRPQATNDVVAVLRVLAPTSHEVGERLADHLALLVPGTASTAAGLAQESLIAAHRAGTVSAADLITASSTVLARDDKKLLRTQLAWLERHRAAHPDHAAAVAAAATVALDNGTSDIAQRAAGLLERPDPAAGPAPALVPPTPPEAIAPTPVRSINDLDEMIEHLLIVLRGVNQDRLGIHLEQLVEALPRLLGPDQAAQADVHHRMAEEPDYRSGLQLDEWDEVKSLSVQNALVALVAELVGDGERRPPLSAGASLPPPERALALRLLDLADARRDDPGVRVVALPTDSSGAIDPQVLDERLRAAAQEGWTLAPLDLELAHIRAGRAPHPPPQSQVEVELEERRDSMDWRVLLEPQPVTRVHLHPFAPLDGSTLWGILTGGQPHTLTGRWHPGWWPLLLPHHPAVAAAYLIPELAADATGRIHGLEALLQLAESEHDGGEAVTLAVAHALNAADALARAGALDALLALAAREHLRGAALGHRLAAMVVQGEVTPTRLPAPLLDAARAGIADAVWECLRALLGDLLADVVGTGGRIAGLADLLDRAADVAALSAQPGPVAHLADLAARPGRTRQVIAARLLLERLK